jgi:hypothetical protein
MMARASKPEAGAKDVARERKTTRHADPAPEAMSEPVEAAQPPEVEALVAKPPVAAKPPVEEPLSLEAAEAPGAATGPAQLTEPAKPVIDPTEPADSVEPSEPAMPAEPAKARPPGAAPDVAAPALREVQHLHGITLRFWQDQLERTVATGQAIMVCRSPQEAVRLQIAYAKATLAAGFEHAGHLARLSQGIARDMLPLRPR